jgi:molecular chaperone GrpE
LNDTPHRPLPVPSDHPADAPHLVPDPATGEQTEAAGKASQDPEEEIARLRCDRDRYIEALRRLTADFDNYRKRMLREQTGHIDRAAEGLVRRLLPVLDTVELGARHHPDALEPVYRQLHETLAAEGLRRIDPLGAAFNPAEHQAVEHSAVIPLRRRDTGSDATVAQVLRPGYRFHGRLLRPALVSIHS